MSINRKRRRRRRNRQDRRRDVRWAYRVITFVSASKLDPCTVSSNGKCHYHSRCGRYCYWWSDAQIQMAINILKRKENLNPL